MRISLLLKYIGLILILMLGGCAAGYALAYNGPDPARIMWEQLSPPPEPAKKIIELGGGNQSITIETADGIQYECCGPWLSTWKQVEYKRTRFGSTCDQITSSLIDQLPAKPVDCAYRSQFEWVTEWYYAALLPDGSLWRWRYYHGMGTIFNSAGLGSLVGLLIGSGWIVWRSLSSKAKRIQ